MRRWLGMRPWRTGIAALFFAIVAVGVATGRTPFYSPPYVPEFMSHVSTAPRALCLGRYLVDIPQSFHQRSGGWGEIELYYGLDKNFRRVYASVDDGDITQAQFLSKVKVRRDELIATINEETNKPMLLHSEQIGPDTFLFRRVDSEFYDIAIQSEVHQRVGNRYVRYQMASDDEKSGIGHMSTKNIDPAPSEARLRSIASKLKTEATGGQGFCFQGVIFDVGQDDEVASFHFKTPEVPDLRLSFLYHAVTGQPEESLNERFRRALNVPWIGTRTKALRKRDTKIGGMPAQEALYRTSEPSQHVFRIETRTEKQSLAQPMIAMKILTGQAFDNSEEIEQPEAPSSLSDEQAIDLWDAIVKSVRLRPRSLPAGMTALGDWVPVCRFGDTCPRSGYWMKQVTHRDFEFNGYHALPRVHQPFKKGQLFLPDIEDELRFRPFTTWTWRRDLE